MRVQYTTTTNANDFIYRIRNMMYFYQGKLPDRLVPQYQARAKLISREYLGAIRFYIRYSTKIN